MYRQHTCNDDITYVQLQRVITIRIAFMTRISHFVQQKFQWNRANQPNDVRNANDCWHERYPKIVINDTQNSDSKLGCHSQLRQTRFYISYILGKVVPQSQVVLLIKSRFKFLLRGRALEACLWRVNNQHMFVLNLKSRDLSSLQYELQIHVEKNLVLRLTKNK